MRAWTLAEMASGGGWASRLGATRVGGKRRGGSRGAVEGSGGVQEEREGSAQANLSEVVRRPWRWVVRLQRIYNF